MASMRKGEPAAVTLGAAIDELWLAGAPLAWPAPDPAGSAEHCAPISMEVLGMPEHMLGAATHSRHSSFLPVPRWRQPVSCHASDKRMHAMCRRHAAVAFVDGILGHRESAVL